MRQAAPASVHGLSPSASTFFVGQNRSHWSPFCAIQCRTVRTSINQYKTTFGRMIPIFATVLRSVKYAPPISGSLMVLKKLPRDVNMSVLLNDVPAPNKASMENSKGWSVKLVAPDGNTPIKNVTKAASTNLTKYLWRQKLISSLLLNKQ